MTDWKPAIGDWVICTQPHNVLCPHGEIPRGHITRIWDVGTDIAGDIQIGVDFLGWVYFITPKHFQPSGAPHDVPHAPAPDKYVVTSWRNEQGRATITGTKSCASLQRIRHTFGPQNDGPDMVHIEAEGLLNQFRGGGTWEITFKKVDDV